MNLPDLTSVHIKGLYEADERERFVWLNEKMLSPLLSQKIYCHSPDGFNWGYLGSGCAQLALAILLELLPVPMAERLKTPFKEMFIAPLEQGKDFEIKINLKKWIETVS